MVTEIAEKEKDMKIYLNTYSGELIRYQASIEPKRPVFWTKVAQMQGAGGGLLVQTPFKRATRVRR